MKPTKRALPALLLTLLALPLATSTTISTVQSVEDIQLCDFHVSEEIKRANATFSVIFQMDVGEDGRPEKITPIRNQFLDDKPFSGCLRGWLLSVKNQRVILMLTWEHGKGWTQLDIRGSTTAKRISLHPGFCAY